MTVEDHTRVEEYLKRLIEIADVYTVDADGYITRKHDNEKVAIVRNKKSVPLRAYRSLMDPGEYAILNPFNNATSLPSAEKLWFRGVIESTVALYFQNLVRKAVQMAVHAKTDDGAETPMEATEIVASIIDRVDDKMLEELKQLVDFAPWATIFFSKKDHRSQLQIELFAEEFQKEHTKIRKKTWTVIHDVLSMVLGTPPEIAHQLFEAKNTIIGLSEIETLLIVFTKVMDVISEPVKILLDADLKVGELYEHLGRLETYRHITRWCLSDTVKDTPKTDPPWKTVTPQMQMPQAPAQQQAPEPQPQYQQPVQQPQQPQYQQQPQQQHYSPLNPAPQAMQMAVAAQPIRYADQTPMYGGYTPPPMMGCQAPAQMPFQQGMPSWGMPQQGGIRL